MVRIFWPIVLTLSLISICLGNQDQKYRTNLELLREILKTSLAELQEQQIINPDDNLAIKITAQDSAFVAVQQTMIKNILIDELDASVYDEPNTVQSGKIIHLNWFDWRISYVPLKHHFWQKSKLQRNLIADFYVEVLNKKENKVLFSKHFQKQDSDIVLAKDKKAVENPGFAFTTGGIYKKDGFVKKWLEPVFLFAISASVIYLFYSVRSQ